MTREENPRPLNYAEVHILKKILSAEFGGAEELTAQIGHTCVVSHWGSESPSVDLRVADPVQRAPIPDGLIPASGAVTDASGQLAGELLVWVCDGFLSALEYSWYTDEAPTELPSLENVTVTL